MNNHRNLIQHEYISAGSPNTAAETLRGLSLSNVAAVRRRVAENSNTPSEVLANMASDLDSQVRIAVGLNSATPFAVLSHVVFDDDPDVRYSIASASYLPERLLMELVADTNPYVSSRAKKTLAQARHDSLHGKMTIFDYLEQDHLLVTSRLEKLMEHASTCSRSCLHDESADAFDGLRWHFGRQRVFCLDKISAADIRSRNLLRKAETDHIQIDKKLIHLASIPDDRAPDLCTELPGLLELVVEHIEFAEMELFDALRRHISPNEIDEMNLRLNDALFSADL